MRVIIIEDKDARSLLEKLELQEMRKNNILRADFSRPPTTEEIHRAFHYVVVCWLQEQGAKLH